MISGGEGGGGRVVLVPYGPKEPLPITFSALIRYLGLEKSNEFQRQLIIPYRLVGTVSCIMSLLISKHVQWNLSIAHPFG